MAEPAPRDCRVCPAILSLATSILFWSSVPLLLRYFTHLMDAWTVNGLRYSFAALFWLPFVLRHRREVPEGRNIWRDAIPPTIVHVIGQMLFGLTPYFNDATVMNFVSRSSFLFVTLFGLAMLPEERPLARRALFWAGAVGTAAGLVTMYRGGLGTASTSAGGMLLLVGTSSLWGLYSVLIRKCMRGYSVRLSFGVISLYAAPFLLGLMFAVGDWHAALKLDLLRWVLVWVSAVAGIAIGHTFFFKAIHALGPIFSEGTLLLIPFLTAVLAFFVLHEHLSRLQWIGGVILVLGCLLLILAKAQTEWRREEHVAATTD